jgi:hypothetical protein
VREIEKRIIVRGKRKNIEGARREQEVRGREGGFWGVASDESVKSGSVRGSGCDSPGLLGNSPGLLGQGRCPGMSEITESIGG